MSVKKLQKSFVPSVLTTGSVNPINSIIIQLKDATRPSRIVLTAFLIALEPPANTWFLAFQYVCFLLNDMYNNTLQAVPLTCLKGVTVDIGVLLRFHFWQPVYSKLSESSFPSESKEALGHVVGISEHCGHALTYKILS
jgi:hypothetical protein